MAKVTREQIECDLCGKEGERYTISYPEGMKILDRCSRHRKKLMDLKEEAGEWTAITTSNGHKRGKLTVLTPQEINDLREA